MILGVLFKFHWTIKVERPSSSGNFCYLVVMTSDLYEIYFQNLVLFYRIAKIIIVC